VSWKWPFILLLELLVCGSDVNHLVAVTCDLVDKAPDSAEVIESATCHVFACAVAVEVVKPK
jgi:hypothetical protein